MVLHAGRLDRRVTIQAVTPTLDAARGPVETYADLATVGADVRPISGREFLAADQDRTETTTRITIRWRSDVTTRNRVVHDGTTYAIVHVADLGRREGLDLLCVEVQP